MNTFISLVENTCYIVVVLHGPVNYAQHWITFDIT